MKWAIMANVPDQDHIRTWTKIGECSTLEEFEEKKEAFIERMWHVKLRLRQPGSFELVRISESLND